MRTIMLREKHKHRLYLLGAAVAAIVWFYFNGFPGFGELKLCFTSFAECVANA